MTPPNSRLTKRGISLDQHFKEQQNRLYVRRGYFPLRSLDATPITKTPDKATTYSLKGIKQGDFSWSDLIILPRPQSQVTPREAPDCSTSVKQHPYATAPKRAHKTEHVRNLRARVRSLYQSAIEDRAKKYCETGWEEYFKQAHAFKVGLNDSSRLIDDQGRFESYDALLAVRNHLQKYLYLVGSSSPSKSQQIISLLNEINAAEDVRFNWEKEQKFKRTRSPQMNRRENRFVRQILQWHQQPHIGTLSNGIG